MAFTVEDGSGMSNANAYATVGEVDAYISDYARDENTWVTATNTAKQGYIKEATQSLDLLWGDRFIGVKNDVNQSLLFPRYGAYDRDGYAVASDAVPSLIKQATAELAYKHAFIGGTDKTAGDTSKIIADIDGGGLIAEESVAVGSIKTTTKYEGGKREQKWFRKVDLLLRSLLRPRGRINRA